MSRYFFNGTALETLEVLMMIPTGFLPKPRNTPYYRSTVRCDCCLHRPQGKKTCGGSCPYLNEKIHTKSISQLELARQTAMKLGSSLLRTRIEIFKKLITWWNIHFSKYHTYQWNELMERREYLHTTNKMAAALFLLTATETLWERVKEQIRHNHIQFSEVCLRGMDTTDYTLFQFAKSLYLKGTLDMEGVTDREIVDADLFPTVLCAIILRMHGLEALHTE